MKGGGVTVEYQSREFNEGSAKQQLRVRSAMKQVWKEPGGLSTKSGQRKPNRTAIQDNDRDSWSKSNERLGGGIKDSRANLPSQKSSKFKDSVGFW